MYKLEKWLLISMWVLGNCQASGLISPDQAIKGDDDAQYVDMDAFCQTSPCRQDVHFLLKTDQGKIDQKSPVYWPVVQGEQISLLAGEKVFIEAKLTGKRFTEFTAVATSKQAISFDLRQNEDDLGMLLVVKNPFEFPIKVSIDMIDFEGNLHETSSCPVIAGGAVYEMWPHPIPEMLISNFRKLGEDEAMSCVY